MANIILLLVPLFLIFSIISLPLPARAISSCNGPCKTLNDCNGQLICINGKCNDDPDIGTHICSGGGGGGGSSPSPSQNCKSSGTLTCGGNSHPQYRCSPPLTSSTQARLTLNDFSEGGDGGGPSECDEKYRNNSERVVALSTGWYNHGSRCGKTTASDTQLYQCKPNLALFMAGLGHMEITESDESAKCSAIWELYHMLLREQHWALIHLAITAFGYFAARTSCNQLWRFVPQTAALSYDLSGDEANEERFMSELKAFLEKEMALLTITPSSEQLGLLVSDGLMLKEVVRKFSEIDAKAMGYESMVIDEEKQLNKKRKLPDGISEGVELLQSGLKVIDDGLFEWQQNHSAIALNAKFLTHISRLKDAVAQLVGLAGSG